MPMRTVHVVFDAADVDALRDFWVAAVGLVPHGRADQYRSAVPPDGEAGPKFVFQEVAEPPPAGKNRLHLDIEVGDAMESEVARLIDLGAQRLTELIEEAGTSWTVMADPEGNEFCLVHH